MRLNVLLLFWCCLAFGQKSRPDLAVSKIDSLLVKGVDAVVRHSNVTYSVLDQDKMVVNTERTVTAFNNTGMGFVDLMEGYGKHSKVLEIELQVYDAAGNLQKVYRKRDFKDEAAFDGFSVFSDDRVLNLDLNPPTFPVTCRFTSKVENESTAFVQAFMPLVGTRCSVEYAVVSFELAPGLQLRHHANETAKSLVAISSDGLTFNCSKLKPVVYEYLSESFLNNVPFVRFSFNKFALEGVKGEASDWNSWGKWYYNALLKGTDELPTATREAIVQLTKDAKTKTEKAALVYDYVKKKVRYISVQDGIGGFKPMLASDVDRLSYGDCKALTNYTRALLKAAGVPSFFTIVYGDDDKRSIDKNFVSLQGNHAILAIPENNDYIWVECTSQDLPFGFAGAFTADRDVLVIKDELGGEIAHTKTFKPEDNTKKIVGLVNINSTGGMKSAVKIESFGIHFDNNYRILNYDAKKRDERYKEMFSSIHDASIQNIKLSREDTDPKFVEELEVVSENFIEKAGEYHLIRPTAIIEPVYIPKRIRNRKTSFIIDEPEVETASITVVLADNQKWDILPENININSEFGTYSISFQKVDEKSCKVLRTLSLKKGVFSASDFDKYRKFLEQVNRSDQSKLIVKI
ncbi:DUF3858 domain-containing protein [Flavobacterium sp.]|uniref:transglutaminase domain-containing protein n=1 Tax=Flavobacterium sp. TaxID=239 RepID=UPI00260A54FF|nr:DUF3858 domain-containing protein [Flavobacterium sp.]